MSEQTFPLGDFNDLESSVKSITQQPKSQKQQARPLEQKMPQEADASKRDWMHFTFICSIEIVDKVKTIAHRKGPTTCGSRWQYNEHAWSAAESAEWYSP